MQSTNPFAHMLMKDMGILSISWMTGTVKVFDNHLFCLVLTHLYSTHQTEYHFTKRKCIKTGRPLKAQTLVFFKVKERI